ncbi:MAG: hypothetical protein PF513_03150 [Tenericutes bacterium]|jgi:hypothetical protein|nr:hypothetical protein [Mycoplasmatota bacterium]
MAEVRKHIPLTIVRPSVEVIQEIKFVANVTDYLWKIPFRYPFADIENYAELVTAGYFRHATTDVSTEIGGSKVADENTNLGFELPNTEKLILLVKVNADVATAVTVITITGSDEYNIEDVTYEIALDATAGQVFEIDLYNFGLYIDSGEVNVSIASTTVANDAKIDVALIARMA